MTNGDGGPQTPASASPVPGGGSPPQGGPLAVGLGSGGPGGGAFGGPGDPVGPGGLPVPLSPAQVSRGGSRPPAGPAPRKGSRLSISNWRVRWRLIAIIAVPTVTALILGSIQVVNSVRNYQSFKRVQTLANLNALAVQAAAELADERDDTAGYVAAGRAAGGANAAALLAQVNKDQAATKVTTTQIQQQAGAVVNGSGYRAQTVLDLSNGVLAGFNDLQYIRQAALGTKAPATTVIINYARLLQALTAFSDDVAAGTGNATLQSDVSVLNSLLKVEDDASLQRAYLYQALAQSLAPGGKAGLSTGALSALNQAAAQEQADLNAFNTAATVTQQQQFANTVAGPQVDEAKSAETLAIASQTNTGKLTIGTPQGCQGQTSAGCWLSTKSYQIKQMRSVSNGLVSDITAQANSLANSSLRSALITAVATLALLIIVLLITTFVARSMIRPLRRLRTEALEVAGSKLPEMVRRLSQSEGGDTSADIEPIGVNSTDEIGEVARAFDQVHREAVRLAADEAMLRGNLNAMFVNLSRRSQSLIERQLSLIDNLEQTEQDADRLSSLFRLDHLATRMRRNSENLLVLAGHEAASRRWSQPVPLVDVLRAAISEIEQYERVVLNVQPGIVVVGQAVNDVVHLAAELVENATAFSPEETQVFVTGQHVSTGGVLIEITDDGLGIAEADMAYANWRLENPPVVDVAVSRRMGLFVVGRLAARHGVRVRLRPANSGRGLCALIWLPDTVAAETGDMAPPMAPEFGRPTRPLSALRSGPKRTGPGRHAGPDTIGNRVAAGTNWFRRGAKPAGVSVGANTAWASPGDEGFRTAASVVTAPVTGDTTRAGLPRRVPSANLVPGSAGEPEPDAPSMSADAARMRMAGFARGGRRGRQAAGN